ncbi:orotidine-5'-phosphate decarboxylase [Dactylosporangium sp. CA-139066]|uniref:orotidine-5'-phosphate decarboxylase n=1 Tax=Dactylosporangium sp. CA-139066 TaxID=3239930 RepID=UPI003D900CD6
MTERFGARLRAAMDALGPLCVGIDPHPSLLARWGLSDDVNGLEAFVRTAGEALAGRVAAIKPQSAFFERFGSRGIAVLESAIRQLRGSGSLVILDVKRGDIGSTAAAYADAYLDPASPLCADAVTVSPYLGFGSLAPIIDKAQQNGLGAFVLAMTSNPEGASVQRAVGAGGRSVAQAVVDEISQVNAGVRPMGDVGAVIGATVGDTGLILTDLNGPILAPGLGAQGGRAEDLRAVFGDALPFVLPSWSREVLSAGPDVSALRAAAQRARDSCASAIAVTA